MCCMYRFVHPVLFFSSFFFFFFNDTATTEIYTLSLHDALPISFAGGILGVLMMVPVRRALIIKEHGVLPYPEGTACADVLIAGERGGKLAGMVFAGLGIGALWKSLSWIFNLFLTELDYSTPRTSQFPNAT